MLPGKCCAIHSDPAEHIARTFGSTAAFSFCTQELTRGVACALGLFAGAVECLGGRLQKAVHVTDQLLALHIHSVLDAGYVWPVQIAE